MASDNTPDNGLETIGDLLDAFDCSQDGREGWWEDLDGDGYKCGSGPVPITSPTGMELQAWLYEKVGPVLEAGIENLNDVSEDFSLDFRVPNTSHTERFVSDYADVLVLRTFFRMLLASIQIQYASNLDVDFHFLDNLYPDHIVHMEDILYYYDSFLTRIGNYYSLLDDAKRQLASMSDDAMGAIDLLKNRDYGGGVNYLLDLEDLSDSEQMKADLNSFKNSLDGDAEIEIKGLVRSINLSPFFAGLLDIRDFLPDFVKDEPVEGTMDGSFGGMVDPPLELRRITWSNGEISTTASLIGGYGTISLSTGDTVYVYGSSNTGNTGLWEMFSQPRPIFSENYHAGQNWSQSHGDIEGYYYNINTTIDSISETVVTPAGTFENCVQITHNYIYDIDPGTGQQFTQSITRYFKRDVGIVKMVVERPAQTDTAVLINYSVSGDGPVPLVEGNTWTYQWDKWLWWQSGNTETYTVIWAHVFSTDWELY